MAGMIKYLQSFRFKGLTVILGVFLAISVVLWTERSGIQYQADVKKNAYLDRDTVVTETQAVKNIGEQLSGADGQQSGRQCGSMGTI